MERRRENLKPKVACFIKIGIMAISGEMAQILQDRNVGGRVCRVIEKTSQYVDPIMP